MLHIEMATQELSERLAEDLRRFPFDEFLDALEESLLDRQGDDPTAELPCYGNLAATVREFKAQDYEPFDMELNSAPKFEYDKRRGFSSPGSTPIQKAA